MKADAAEAAKAVATITKRDAAVTAKATADVAATDK